MDPKTIFTRRAFLLAGGQSLLGAGLLGRLYWLQVQSKEHFKTLSDKNRLHAELMIPLRGQILDEKGYVLAGNQYTHRAILMRSDSDQWKESLYQVKELLLLSEEDMEHMLEITYKKSKFVPYVIKDPLSWEEVAKLELHLLNLPGIRIEQGQQRFYPYPLEFCHALGYVGKPSEKEMENMSSEDFDLYQNPGFRLGKTGVEKMYEKTLLGQPGVKQVEVNAYRQVVRELESFAPKHGEDLQTSLNLSLHTAIYERIKEYESASVVVMDVKTGGIKAALSTPAFDMNQFTNGIPQKVWAPLQSNPYNPLLCKFSQGQYAPGSPFKMMTALAGLYTKKATKDTQFFCPGHYDLGGHRFHCWRHEYGHGSVNMRQALAQSCDVYFYELALRTGVDAIAEVARKFGLGDVTSLAFPHEKAGLIPNKSWKERVRGKKWTTSETILTSIGQGYVLATPLQLCVMTARLASFGKRVDPSFIHQSKDFEDLGFHKDDLELVCQGMRDVMSDPTGTAYRSRSMMEGVDFAGKTGTAQVRRLSQKDRESKAFQNWPWHWRDHAIFTGYAPAADPRFAVSIVVEHGGSGSKVAAPLGRDVLTLALQHSL